MTTEKSAGEDQEDMGVSYDTPAATTHIIPAPTDPSEGLEAEDFTEPTAELSTPLTDTPELEKLLDAFHIAAQQINIPAELVHNAVTANYVTKRYVAARSALREEYLRLAEKAALWAEDDNAFALMKAAVKIRDEQLASLRAEVVESYLRLHQRRRKMTEKSELGVNQEVATASPSLVNSKNHRPGRELDALVAEKVMGNVAWDVVIAGCSRGGRRCGTVAEAKEYRKALQKFYQVGAIVLHDTVSEYSTDIAAAWEVVEKMSDRFHWRIQSPFEAGGLWFAGLTPLGATGWNGRPDYNIGDHSAPLAICLAALKAVGA
jgi:Phage ABA sandwich domain